MDRDRRSFLSLSAFAPVVAAIPLEILFASSSAAGQGARKTPKAELMPLAEDAVAPEPGPPDTTKALLGRNQLQLKEDVERLCALAEQLKQQVDRTDSKSFLSLGVVDSAKKLENLAKQIRTLARE